MAAEKELVWDDYLDIILNRYEDRPDDFIISVGDWKSDSDGWPEFRAFMQMRLGDLRSFKK